MTLWKNIARIAKLPYLVSELKKTSLLLGRKVRNVCQEGRSMGNSKNIKKNNKTTTKQQQQQQQQQNDNNKQYMR